MTSIVPRPLDRRTTALPIGRPEWWQLYEKAQRLIWFSWDIDYSHELQAFARLDPARQRVVKNILGFFANSDKLVNDNIEQRFAQEIDIYECSCMYVLQQHMENVHNTTYSMLLEAIIDDTEERARLLAASTTIPVVRAMAEFICATTASSEPFSTRVLRMVCVEGVMFASAFCYIYWLASEGLMPALAHSNELIQRDELLHAAWGAEIYRACTVKPADPAGVIREAVRLAQEFATETLTDGALSLPTMHRYIEYTADKCAVMCGMGAIYGSKCEFGFMAKAMMKNQTDFFHRNPTEYSLSAGADNGEINVEI